MNPLSYLVLFFLCFSAISAYTPPTALELTYLCGSAT
jgi:hypothetical protein